MAKIKQRSSAYDNHKFDTIYLFRLATFLIIGSVWLRLVNPEGTKQLPIPLGLLFGLTIAWQDRFKIDRKIEYAVLLVAMFVGYWAPIGIYLTWLK